MLVVAKSRTICARPAAMWTSSTWQEPWRCSMSNSYGQPGFAALKARVEAADVFILGTPDYHGSISSALKNFLDHFWREFTETVRNRRRFA